MSRTKHPPGVGLIRSIANQSFSLARALKEAIDNALDCGATSILIRIRPEYFEIKDNGHGTSQPHLIVQLGERSDHDQTQLGMHGIGAKDCLLWIGKEHSTVRIVTTHEGIQRTLVCDWQDYAVNGWELDDPTEEPGSESGTSIIVAPNKASIPKGQHWESMLRELGYTYSRALKDGKTRIEIVGPTGNSSLLQRWQPPRFEGGVINQTITVNGKRAHVFCGVVPSEESNPRAGFTYYAGFRVIVRASDNGCGDYNPAHVCGVVELIDRRAWGLSKNKDDFQDAEALYRQVEDVCRPVLERADSIGSEICSDLFEGAIASRINAALGLVGATRSKNSNTDAHGTGNGTRKHTTTTKPQGDGTRRSTAGSISLKHARMGPDVGYGEMKSRTVILNLDNPLIAAAHREKNILAATAAALTLVGYEHCHPTNKSLRLRLDETEFSRVVGQLMTDSTSADVKDEDIKQLRAVGG